MSAHTPSQRRPTGSTDSQHASRHAAFDPEPHREILVALIREIEALPDEGRVLAPAALEPILRRHPRDGRGFYSRAQIIAGFRAFREEAGFTADETTFARRVQLRPVRTQSGVTPLTVLTRPHPCPGTCVFCPNDVRMPKSYLADEPGAQRAAHNEFDPYLQTWNRLAAYHAIGHPVDKVELIVLGGTWSSYPPSYQIWFVKRCFDAQNDFGSGVDRRDGICSPVGDASAIRDDTGVGYNDTVSGYLRDRLDGRLLGNGECATWAELEAAQQENETAACRNVGLVVETRPDLLSAQEVVRIRRLGCTKVQLGYQSLSDPILSANRRGHDVAATRRAMRLLRGAGFKIHAHWMPNLLGASPESDLEDFGRIFDSPDFRPDELKIYPCSLIETAELMRYYERGEWRPYTHAELLDVVAGVLGRVPRYCRVSRVIRDISSNDIVAGNKLTNFRQIAEAELERRGSACRDIRAREVRHEGVDTAALELRATPYETSTGREVFLEFVSAGDRIVAFLRLALPTERVTIGEIDGSALVREVHVYGASLELGARDGDRAQHRGLGQALVEEATRRARDAGYTDLAVISAVGTRGYYRRLGFVDGPLYQHRALDAG